MTRDDLEQLDTKRLRALAKERFAQKARGLRSRGALLAALTRTLTPAVPPTGPRGRAGRQSGVPVGGPPTSAAPARSRTEAAHRPGHTSQGVATEEALVEEGFFLGRPRKPKARRPVPPTTEQAQAPEPELRPAPPLEDDVPHLLARDATTLFLFWDFARHLERGAALGLPAPSVRFRLYDEEAWVRTVETSLGRQSLYLEGLEPGHLYSVEAWLSANDGNERPTGRRSAAVRLPPAVPSRNFEVRLQRVPWEEPLGAGRHSAARPTERLAPPARVELPASLEWRGGVGRAGPTSGRP